jgi:small subunit ribosomal protein S20
LANKRSAMKAHRVSERRRLRNRSVRSALRTYVKKARVDMAAGETEEAAAAVLVAAKHLDSAANKGIIHKNQAARRKSRLMRQLAAQQRAATSEATAEAAPAPARRRTTTARTTGTRTTTRTRRT